jgi:hypothetical protein
MLVGGPMPLAEKMAVAVLDILGFKALLRAHGPEALFESAMRPLNDAVANAAIVGEVESGLPAKVQSLCLSDTIVLYRSIEWEHAALHGRLQIAPEQCLRAVGGAVAELVKRGIQQTPALLFRGAIAYGECLVHGDQQPYCYLGAPILEAHELEVAQDWAGVALAPSAAGFVDEVRDALLFLEYPAPLKSQSRAGTVEPSHVVNWLSHAITAESLAASFGPATGNAGVESKRKNTVDFLECFKDLTRPPAAVTYSRGGG